jgi:hypothetical protein
MRQASFFRLRDRYFIHPEKQTTAGLLLAQGDFTSLPLSASAEQLGVAVLAALEQSAGVVPHPTQWTGLMKPRLAAAGVRSERAFMRDACLVSVSLGDKMSLKPHANGGSTGDGRGFSPIPARSIAIPAESPANEIGDALVKALGACEDAA